MREKATDEEFDAVVELWGDHYAAKGEEIQEVYVTKRNAEGAPEELEVLTEIVGGATNESVH